MFGMRGWADAKAVERYPHHWIAIGQVGRFFRLAHAEQCREAVLIGTLLRPPLAQIRLDWHTIRLMPRIIRAFRGGDDHLLSGIARCSKRAGEMIGVNEVAPEIIVPAGALGRHQPSPRDRADIARALDVIAALGPFDVGQAVVVADGHVLAVEAAEGTDNLLARVAQLRGQGRLTKPAGRRRSRQGAEARPGPPLRPAGDRAEDRRKRCARRSRRDRRRRRRRHHRRAGA